MCSSDLLRLDDDSAGRVREARWTPNRVDIDVDLARPATLVLNQNWNEHWRADRGAVVKWGGRWPADADGGRLAVATPGGRYRLSVYYRPRSFVAGAAVSVVGWPLLLVLFAASRTRVRRPAADNV